jgi:hypothetical protein
MNTVQVLEYSMEDPVSYNFGELQEKLANIIEQHNHRGFEVVSVTPITSGVSEYSNTENESYGYGYSYTSGYVIVFKELLQYNEDKKILL